MVKLSQKAIPSNHNSYRQSTDLGAHIHVCAVVEWSNSLVASWETIHGFARTVNHVFDVFTCSGSYVTRPLVGKKRMLTDM